MTPAQIEAKIRSFRAGQITEQELTTFMRALSEEEASAWASSAERTSGVGAGTAETIALTTGGLAAAGLPLLAAAGLGVKATTALGLALFAPAIGAAVAAGGEPGAPPESTARRARRIAAQFFQPSDDTASPDRIAAEFDRTMGGVVSALETLIASDSAISDDDLTGAIRSINPDARTATDRALEGLSFVGGGGTALPADGVGGFPPEALEGFATREQIRTQFPSLTDDQVERAFLDQFGGLGGGAAPQNRFNVGGRLVDREGNVIFDPTRSPARQAIEDAIAFDRDQKLAAQGDEAAMARVAAQQAGATERARFAETGVQGRFDVGETGINRRFDVSETGINRRFDVENARLLADLQERGATNAAQVAREQAVFERDVLRSPSDFLARSAALRGEESPLSTISQADTINALRDALNEIRAFQAEGDRNRFTGTQGAPAPAAAVSPGAQETFRREFERGAFTEEDLANLARGGLIPRQPAPIRFPASVTQEDVLENIPPDVLAEITPLGAQETFQREFDEGGFSVADLENLARGGLQPAPNRFVAAPGGPLSALTPEEFEATPEFARRDVETVPVRRFAHGGTTTANRFLVGEAGGAQGAEVIDNPEGARLNITPISGRFASQIPPSGRITQDLIRSEARRLQPPAVRDVLAGQQPADIRFNVEGLQSVATPQLINSLTDDEFEALRTRLAAENISLDDYLFNIQQRFAPASGRGQARFQVA